MSATALKRRGNVSTAVEKPLTETDGWKQTFPKRLVNMKESSRFAKCLLTTAVSNIAYFRNLLEDECFKKRHFEDKLELRFIRRKDDNTMSKCIYKSLKGAFEAIEKMYLRELHLFIFSKGKNAEVYEELYSFTFSYSDGVTSMSFNRDNYKYHNEIYHSARRLLLSIKEITQSFPLPDGEMAADIRLLYNESVPKEYEPPGFGPCPMPKRFKPEYLQSEIVKTHFHSITCRVQPPKIRSDSEGPVFIPDKLVDEEPFDLLSYNEASGDQTIDPLSSQNQNESRKKVKIDHIHRAQAAEGQTSRRMHESGLAADNQKTRHAGKPGRANRRGGANGAEPQRTTSTRTDSDPRSSDWSTRSQTEDPLSQVNRGDFDRSFGGQSVDSSGQLKHVRTSVEASADQILSPSVAALLDDWAEDEKSDRQLVESGARKRQLQDPFVNECFELSDRIELSQPKILRRRGKEKRLN